MKIVRSCIYFCLVLLLANAASAANEVKFGAVDFRKVVQESESGKKAAETLKGMYEKFQASLNDKAKELEKSKKDLEGKAKSLSAAKLQEREAELKKKFQEYQEFGRNAEKELQAKEAEMTDEIGENLLKLIKNYGTKNGYAAIFRQDNLMYLDGKYEAKNLTDEIMKELDASGKAK